LFFGKIEVEEIGLATVFIVDDDKAVGLALQRLLRAEGYSTQVWSSAKAFLTDHDPDAPGCLVTDLMMPGMSGLDLLRTMARNGCSRPIIFVTAGNLAPGAMGMPAGEFSILSKPVDCADLLEAVREALEKDEGRRAQRREGHERDH
jgi:FixJ family two-component response regulator